MEQLLRHYHVFISYRHNDRDKRIAEELQKRLEKYKVRNPETGRMEWLTVFRDQSELPTSNDLGKNIETALEASDYLVIICSRDYQKSIWCMRELSYFRELHSNSNTRILPIITEGELEECFPPEICFREETIYNGETSQTVQIQIEPLAADVRGTTLAEQIKKLRSTEYMRIAAPVLGVPYDALYQRRARSRFQKVLAAVFTALVLATGFGVYNFSVNQKLTAQQEKILETDSRNLAHTAQLLLEDGQRKQALETILQAFSSENQERPSVPEAIQTLSKMMGEYQVPSYQTTQIYQGYNEIKDVVLSEDGRYLVMITSEKNIVCYDFQKQQEIWQYYFEEINFQAIIRPKLVHIPDSNSVLVIEADRIVKYFIPTGKLQWECNLFGEFTDDYNSVVSPDGKQIAICTKARKSEYEGKTTYVVHFIDTETGEERGRVGGFPYSVGDYLCPDENYQKFRVGASGFSEDSRYFTMVIDHDPSENCTVDFFKLAVIDLKENAFCGYFTAKAGANTRRVGLGKEWYRHYVDLVPVTDIYGVKCGYYYCIKVIEGEEDECGAWDSTSQEDVTLFAGTVSDKNLSWDFQASYPSVSGKYAFRTVSANGLGAFRIDERMLFVADQGMAIIELDANAHREYDFPSNVIQLFLENGEIQALFADGILKKINVDTHFCSLTLELVQRKRIAKENCGIVTKPINGQMALIPEYASNTALICKKIGDPTGKTVAFPNFYDEMVDAKLIPVSSNKLLALNEGYDLPLALLDIQNMCVTTLTADHIKNHEFQNMICQGTSADAQWLILGNYIWDLSSNTFVSSAQYPWQGKNLCGLSFLASDSTILSPGAAYLVYFYESSEQWWYNGDVIEVPMEYQGSCIADMVIHVDENFFMIGQNGLLAAKVGIDEKNVYSGLMVFSAKDQVWRYVPSNAGAFSEQEIVPCCASAQNNPWIGVAELDGVLRVYDWEKDSYIRQYTLNVPPSSICYMSCFGDDQYMLLGTDERLQILDLETGRLLLDEATMSFADDELGYARGLVPYDCSESGESLAVYLKSNKNYGLCINTKTWEIEDKIPDLQFINDSVVVTSSSIETMNVYSRWSIEDLLAAARQELSEYSSE